jgi:hypothetical protein
MFSALSEMKMRIYVQNTSVRPSPVIFSMCGLVSAKRVSSDFHEIRCRSYLYTVVWSSASFVKICCDCHFIYGFQKIVFIRSTILDRFQSNLVLPFNIRYFCESLCSESLTVLKKVMTAGALFWAVRQLSSTSGRKCEITQIIFNFVVAPCISMIQSLFYTNLCTYIYIINH